MPLLIISNNGNYCDEIRAAYLL